MMEDQGDSEIETKIFKISREIPLLVQSCPVLGGLCVEDHPGFLEGLRERCGEVAGGLRAGTSTGSARKAAPAVVVQFTPLALPRACVQGNAARAGLLWRAYPGALFGLHAEVLELTASRESALVSIVGVDRGPSRIILKVSAERAVLARAPPLAVGRSYVFSLFREGPGGRIVVATVEATGRGGAAAPRDRAGGSGMRQGPLTASEVLGSLRSLLGSLHLTSVPAAVWAKVKLALLVSASAAALGTASIHVAVIHDAGDPAPGRLLEELRVDGVHVVKLNQRRAGSHAGTGASSWEATGVTAWGLCEAKRARLRGNTGSAYEGLEAEAAVSLAGFDFAFDLTTGGHPGDLHRMHTDGAFTAHVLGRETRHRLAATATLAPPHAAPAAVSDAAAAALQGYYLASRQARQEQCPGSFSPRVLKTLLCTTSILAGLGIGPVRREASEAHAHLAIWLNEETCIVRHGSQGASTPVLQHAFVEGGGAILSELNTSSRGIFTFQEFVRATKKIF